MSNLALAKKLLAWNEANLNASANWCADDLAAFFAKDFVVLANGRRYQANYQNYAEFLNGMRATLQSIQYECHDFIVNDECVVIPLLATLTKLDQSREQFVAILVLKFDADGKIVLWREVYCRLGFA